MAKRRSIRVCLDFLLHFFVKEKVEERKKEKLFTICDTLLSSLYDLFEVLDLAAEETNHWYSKKEMMEETT